jgi:hypothetical protein
MFTDLSDATLPTDAAVGGGTPDDTSAGTRRLNFARLQFIITITSTEKHKRKQNISPKAQEFSV